MQSRCDTISHSNYAVVSSTYCDDPAHAILVFIAIIMTLNLLVNAVGLYRQIKKQN